MSRILKSRGYFKKSLGFVLLLGFISIGAIGGCNSNNNDNPTALTENDFAEDSALRADPEEGVIVDFLENPMSEDTENDTGEVGIDEIPVTYPQTLEQTFCWEDDDPQALHFMELIDSEGSEILRVDVNGECVTEVIEAGDYVMTIHHDGRSETTLPIFIIPNPDDIEEAKETEGLINRFRVAVANILRSFQNTVTKDAIAQKTGVDAIETLLRSKGCADCDLRAANLQDADLVEARLFRSDLSKANLRGANLSRALMNDAILSRSDLGGANLSEADLRRADLSRTDLSGADLSGANLSGAFMFKAELGGADLSGAKLVAVELRAANLSEANLSEADLSKASLVIANLDNANLSSSILEHTNFEHATWCSGGCTCGDDSIDTCIGCASIDTCTGP